VQEELKPFLIGRYPIAGVYEARSGQKLSLLQAYQNQTISKGEFLLMELYYYNTTDVITITQVF